jgi:hypothetical protein
MTRRGKIARLPMDIREEVNRRLENAVEGKQIVEWLNSLPKVRALLKAEFDGQPVNEPNLSHWKSGGYRDWQEHQEALEATRQFVSDAKELSRAAGGDLAGKLAVCLAARLAVAMRYLPSPEEDAKGHLEGLRRLCAAVSRMRKGDHDAEWLRIKREKLALETKTFKSVDSIRKLERKKLDSEVNSGGPITKEGWEQIEKDLKLI